MVGPTCWPRVGYDDEGYYFFWCLKFGKECGCLCGFLLNCKMQPTPKAKTKPIVLDTFILGRTSKNTGDTKSPNPKIFNFLIKGVVMKVCIAAAGFGISSCLGNSASEMVCMVSADHPLD